nr:reverse transcriptase domain-containing protein [Tanacetum cinerariifolium]
MNPYFAVNPNDDEEERQPNAFDVDDESDVYFLQQEYEYHETLVADENRLVLTRKSIDSAFARFNTIITSLKALDEGYSSKNYVRKFLKAPHLKWREKVTVIEESKDLTSLSLDELIKNLKVHELIIKKDFKIVKAKGDRKSLALKAKTESSDEECSNSGSKDEEYAMANFPKNQIQNDKNGKNERKFFRCRDPNSIIEECPKPPKDKNERAFIRGSWNDSGEEDDEKANDETCLMAQASSKTPYEILRGKKPTHDYFRVFGSKCFILNNKEYLTKFNPKSYEGVFLSYSQNSKAYIILKKHTIEIKESLNVTFDETPPPSKTSPLVDDDLDEEEAIKVTEKKNLENGIEGETLEIGEVVSVKESRNHPLENVIGNLNQRTLRRIHKGAVVIRTNGEAAAGMFDLMDGFGVSEVVDSNAPNFKKRGVWDARTRSKSPEQRHGRSKSPREKGSKRRTVFKRLEKAVFHRLGDKEKNASAHSRGSERKTKALLESEESVGGHWKSKPKKQKSSMEDDLSQPWVCEETDPFTPQIRYFDFSKTRMPSHIKTYDGSEDLEDHLKIFQAVAKMERWAMPTWVWFDDLPKESIDSYDDLRKAFLENNLEQKKYIKDPVEIHNIMQRNGESKEEFVRSYKLKCRDVKGASECMKISRFMHEITNPELIKRLHDKIPKSMDEMMSVTVAFLKGEMAANNREQRKSFPSWKQEAGQKQNFKRGNFQNEQRMERKQDRFTLLTKTPREILALDKGKFKPPPPMTTQITQTLSPESVISFPTLGEEDGTEGPMIIEAEMRGHCVHRIYVDGGSSSEILYEHCFSKFRSEIKNQLIPANTPLIGFSEEIIWPLGQISLLVRVCDEEHSTSARMNFMVVRSPTPYNGIIGRPGEGRKELCGLLRRYLEVFAWKPVDMTGVPRHLAEHRINVHEGCLPVRQKKRGQAPERNKAISEKVKKLVEADIMKEVHYHSWLSNPVMVKKHDDSWRMCVDFKT